MRQTVYFLKLVCRFTVLVALLLTPFLSFRAQAAQVTNRQIEISDSTVSAVNVTYRVQFTVPTNVSIGSMQLEFCDNDPFPETACVAPTGFSATNALVGGESGILDFSKSGASTVNKLVLTRPAAQLFGPGDIRFEASNIINPDSARTFYARITTYPTTNGSGAANYGGGIALMTNDNFAVTATVPPFLLFCVAIQFTAYDCNSGSSYFADLGEFSTTAPKTSTSQMVLGTNADFGLAVTVNGTTLTSGNHIIPQLSSPTSSSVGVSQFGINLRANTNPSIGADPVGPGGAVVAAGYNIPNQFKFSSGDAVITSNDVVDYEKFTASYIVNIAKKQPPGVYNTTLTYIALANF